MRRLACWAWVSLLYLLPVAANPPAQSDTTTLREVIVEARGAGRPVKMADDAVLNLDAAVAGERMRAFGEADAIRHLSALPGATSVSDYSSGLSIDGGEFSQTFYGIGGAPVFFPYHFGGIFSVFNAEHLPLVRMEKSIHGPDMPPFVGGRVDFAARPAPVRKLRGMLNIGLIAAGASLAAPAGRSADVAVSARVSFLNLLYGSMLRDNTTDLGYGFGDVNLTARWNPGPRDRLSFHFFANKDHLSTDDGRFSIGTHFGWHNIVAACRWEHTASRFGWAQSVYCSSFGSSFDMAMIQIEAAARSALTQTGTRGSGSLALGAARHHRVIFGGEAALTHLLPQEISLEGMGEMPETKSSRVLSGGLGAHAAWEWTITQALQLTAGGRAYWHLAPGCRTFAADPLATLTWRSGAGTFTLHAGGTTQTLHQVGFSEIGLASNFWIDSGRGLPPQRARTLAAAWVWRPGAGDYELTADVYWKRLTGASEYDGSVITLLGAGYDCTRHILSGRGRNYGAGVMASRVRGRITGSASLSFGRALRRFPGLSEGWVTAAVEQRLRAVLQCHWRVSRTVGADAVWTFATGRPVTPVKALYMIGQNVVAEYGVRNSRTLPPYHRLDLSASWRFRISGAPRIENMLVVSIINAYAHRNVMMMTFAYDRESQTFSRRFSSSLYRFLPSVAYVMRF